VAELVNRVLEVQAPQQRIPRQFGCSQNVATTVAFDFRKREKLPNSAVEVAPYPPVNRSKQSVQRR
jgi:hypothetical protein